MTVTVFPGSADQPFELPEPDWRETFSSDLDQEIASATWRAAVSDMRIAGTISHGQATQLRRYVWFVVRFEHCMRRIDEMDVISVTNAGGGFTTNPLWTIAHQADARATEHEAELGLSPRRRGAVTPAKRRKSAGAADAYLTPKKG